MLESRADIAVHSMKDVPAQQPEGLTLAAFLSGEDPRDAFVSNRFGALAELPADAIVGTSSLRRQAQLRAARPALDRKSVVSGKSVSVRVDIGGRSISKKKNHKTTTNRHNTQLSTSTIKIK